MNLNNTFVAPDIVRIEEDIRSLARAYALFSRCHASLLDHLLIPENDTIVAESFLPNQEPSIRDLYILELNHKVYAAATSLKALLGVSNLLKKRYETADFYEKYFETNFSISNKFSFYFWRKFRNYITHESTGWWRQRLYEFKFQTCCRILLDSTPLLQHDWRMTEKVDSPKDEKMIEYLTRYKEGVYLRNIISNYQIEMDSLWDYVFVEMHKIKTDKLREIEEKNKR